MDPTEETDAIPLTFEEVQDEHGNDLLVARDRAQMSPEERARSRDNIHCLVEQLRATARPIHQPTDG